MRKLAILICTCILFAAPSLSVAQSKGPDGAVPDVVLAGLQAYKNGGAQAAVQAWIKGGPLDGSADASSDVRALDQIQQAYGGYRSCDVIHAGDLTRRIRVIYLAMYFERGPLFAKFVVYRTGATWVLTSFKFNSDADAILPYAPLGP
ncbi:MAG: hypothetical protein ACRD3F_11325 [Acidobacteriaceae bacterium]